MNPLEDRLNERLADLSSRGLHRRMLTLTPQSGVRARLGGKPCLVFASNDYLSLSDHPDVVARMREALDSHGGGAPASRMISGNTDLHEALEKALARFKGKDDAVLFPAGFMANLAALTTLAGKGDCIFSDGHNHASIVDACRLSQARIVVYPHGDAEALAALVDRHDMGGLGFVVTDSVFSMGGDVAPLPALRDLADRKGLSLIVDDAHATGVIGDTGRGLEEHFHSAGAAEVTVGTLGKALGIAGGFVAGSGNLADLLRNRARTFLYTTAPPPAVCAGALEALCILTREPERVTELRRRSKTLRCLLQEEEIMVPRGETPIIPVVLGSAGRAMEVAQGLREKGFLVTGIRPPTVPDGRSMLRVIVNFGHTEDDLRGFCSALSTLLSPEDRQASRLRISE